MFVEGIGSAGSGQANTYSPTPTPTFQSGGVRVAASAAGEQDKVNSATFLGLTASP